MRGISTTVAFVLLLLLGIAASGGFYLYINRMQSRILTKGSEIMVDAEIPPKLVSLICRKSVGYAYVSSDENLIGKLRYEVRDDSQDLVDSGLIDVSVNGTGRIYFPMPDDASGWYWIAVENDNWRLFDKCKVRADQTLKVWLKLDEGSGTTAGDSSGNGNNGTVHGATWTTGKSGYALSFDGTDDYVWIDNSSSNSINGSLSVSAWVKLDSWTDWARILAKGNYSASPATHNYLLILDEEEGSIGFRFANQTGIEEGVYSSQCGSDPLSVGSWHHVVGVFNGTHATLYVDGTSVCSRAVEGRPTDYGDPLYVGTQGTLGYLNGTVDDVRVYSRALDSYEVKALYEAHSG